MSKDFAQKKEDLLQEVGAVLDDVEELYHSGVEEGSKEAEQLRGKLQRKLQAAQRKLGDFEEVAAERVKQTARQADQLVQDKPYYAMGFAALAGLVVGVLLNRR